jgi:hypothetical protein
MKRWNLEKHANLMCWRVIASEDGEHWHLPTGKWWATVEAANKEMKELKKETA